MTPQLKRSNRVPATLALPFVAALFVAGVPALKAQGLKANEAYWVHGMLQNAYETVKTNYYDPTFHGLDWDARYREFDDKLKTATSVDSAEITVAQFLMGLNDSHTFFQPPPRTFQADYGYRVELIGDQAFITQIHGGTDAAKKLRPGDRVLTMNTFGLDRDSFWTMQYVLNTLAPRATTDLDVQHANGDEQTVTVTTVVHPQRVVRSLTNGNEIGAVDRERQNAVDRLRSRVTELGDVMIWKMPIFALGDSAVDELFGVARKHAGLVLDLRGNPGGRISTLNRMLGNLFDHEVVIGTRTRRAGKETLGASTRGHNGYTGKVVVLIDSGSASASEILARVVQLEHRGTVMGDRSAGAVMEAKQYPFQLGNDALALYVFSVTEADLIMTDGHSLEHVGVTPDELALPTAADLGAGRDPVLSRAAHALGLEISPLAAGKLFPFEWPTFGG